MSSFGPAEVWFISDEENNRLYSVGDEAVEQFFPKGEAFDSTNDDLFGFIYEIFTAVYTTGWNWAMALEWNGNGLE